eukprot:3298463-Amphidinium_carterae.1
MGNGLDVGGWKVRAAASVRALSHAEIASAVSSLTAAACATSAGGPYLLVHCPSNALASRTGITVLKLSNRDALCMVINLP